jgi:hypothetical protein
MAVAWHCTMELRYDGVPLVVRRYARYDAAKRGRRRGRERQLTAPDFETPPVTLWPLRGQLGT